MHRVDPQQSAQLVGRALAQFKTELAEYGFEQACGIEVAAVDNRNRMFGVQRIGKIANQGRLAGKGRPLDQAQAIRLRASRFERLESIPIGAVLDGR